MTASLQARDPRLDLRGDRFLSGLARDFALGRHRELLSPLVFASPRALLDLEPRAGERAGIASELARANASYGHPRARELADRFADPTTLVVVAGQQAGLFGGPLYTLTKMAGAALVAERLERAGRRAVAAFWVATEDHDYAEVARATLSSADGPVTFDLGDDPAPLEPVGMRSLGPALVAVLESTRALYAGTRGDDAWHLLASSYRPEARFGEAFGKLMVGLLGERAPLVVDSMLPSLKRAERPLFARAIERREEIAAALGEQAARVTGTGHSLQVEDDPAAAPLFVLAGRERRRVLWDGAGRWTLRGAPAPARDVAELSALLADNPALISAGVLLRPVAQDAVLGTALQLMGPGELAYLAQAAPLYRVLGVEAPRVALRPQMIVLDAKQRGHLETLDLTLDELLRDEREVHALLARGLEQPDQDGPAHSRAAHDRQADPRLGCDRAARSDSSAPGAVGVAERVETLRAATLRALDAIQAECLELDSGLERPLQKTRDQVDRALELFTAKLHAAMVRRDQTVRSRCAALRAACLPGGAPQERGLAVAHFALRYGLAVGAAVLDQLDVESDAIQIIDPDGAGS